MGEIAGNRLVVFSEKAFLGIVAETYERVGTETGGILLGRFVEGRWYVLETLDPGPNSVFRPAYFEYDTPYVNHLANKVERFYKHGLELVGLWHRHPGSYTSFSPTDDKTNLKYASQTNRGAVSALVNLDPDFRLTVYHVAVPLCYTPVGYEVGDDLIPESIKEQKAIADFPPAQSAPVVSTSPAASASRHVAAPQARHQRRHGSQGCVLASLRGLGKLVAMSWGTRFAPDDQPGASMSVVESSMKSSTEAVLDMIEPELEYLESQTEYDYSIRPLASEIVIQLAYAQQMPYYPKRLEFSFRIIDHVGYVETTQGEQYRYYARFIQDYINRSIVLQ